MLLFDKAKRSYSLAINWMGKQMRVPVFMVGPRERLAGYSEYEMRWLVDA